MPECVPLVAVIRINRTSRPSKGQIVIVAVGICDKGK